MSHLEPMAVISQAEYTQLLADQRRLAHADDVYRMLMDSPMPPSRPVDAAGLLASALLIDPISGKVGAA